MLEMFKVINVIELLKVFLVFESCMSRLGSSKYKVTDTPHENLNLT